MPLFNMNKPLAAKKTIPQVQQIEINADLAGQRLDNFLIKVCKGVPKSHIYKAIRSGQVRVNKGRIKNEYRLAVGDIVRIPPIRMPDADAKPIAPPAQFPIVFEDDYLLVIDKPEGVAVHGGSGVSFGVIEQLRTARPEAKFLELGHRLDRDTSGLLIIAKRRNALVAIHDMFRQGQIDKYYQALVEGDWLNDRQHIRAPLQRWLTVSGERRVRVDPQGKASHTIITLLQRFGRYSLVEAELKTGRTHQIRVHLAHTGFPIVGDDKYGTDAVRAHFAHLGFKRMFLHAHKLVIKHPVTHQVLDLQAPLPADCTAFLKKLESD